MNQKKKWIITITLTLTLFSMMVSCASTPVAEEPIIEESVEDTVIEKDIVEEKVIDENVDESLVLEVRSQADAAKNTAIEAKAPKASKVEYDAAEALYKEANTAQNSIDYDNAVALYRNAIIKYDESTDNANLKRQLALDAIAEAKAAIARTELNSENALAEQVEDEEDE